MGLYTAVKWLSIISIKSEQVSKICSMVKRLSHPMHNGGSSPFNKKQWVTKEWPMCNRAITISSILFFRGQDIHSFNTGNILYNLFSGNSSHSDCHSSNIYSLMRGFRNKKQTNKNQWQPWKPHAFFFWDPNAELKASGVPLFVTSKTLWWRQTK